jgi:HEAT repeat protein
VLAKETDRHVRATAAWALGVIEAQKAPPGLIAAIGDADDDVRTKAAWALGSIHDPAAVPALKAALQREKNTTARRAQLRALIGSGERSEAMLTELLDSSDPAVREAAVRGLAGRSATGPWPWPQPRPRPFP